MQNLALVLADAGGGTEGACGGYDGAICLVATLLLVAVVYAAMYWYEKKKA